MEHNTYHHTSSIITNSCMDYTVSPHIKYHHKVYVWTTQYHHTSSIITNSCVDYTVSPHIKYHHKLLYGLHSITTHQVSSQSLCMDHPVSPQHTAPVTHHCVCCKCIPSHPAFKLLNLRRVKCHCLVAITVAMMTVTTYGKWNCRVHCRSCFYLKYYNG
jgi:hypothetical protein